MDLWIKFIMNLDSKLEQEWVQLLQNDTQLFGTTRNVNKMVRIKTTLKNSLNCHRHCQRYVKCQPARIKKDEQAVQDLILCMDDFNADLFDESASELHSLQSSVIASHKKLEEFRKKSSQTIS